MAKLFKTTFRLRRGSTETWEKNNPVLEYGEPAFDKDKYVIKIGDGKQHWKDLKPIGATEKPETKLIDLRNYKGYISIGENDKTEEIALNDLVLKQFVDLLQNTETNQSNVILFDKESSNISQFWEDIVNIDYTTKVLLDASLINCGICELTINVIQKNDSNEIRAISGGVFFKFGDVAKNTSMMFSKSEGSISISLCVQHIDTWATKDYVDNQKIITDEEVKALIASII